MRYFFSFAFLAAVFCLHPAVYAEDGLFSEVAMESVFEKGASASLAVASLSDGEKLERITGVTSLKLALTAAGFTPTTAGDRVTFQVDHAAWKLPVSLQVQIEQDHITCEMSLIQVEDVAKIDSQALLKLMEKSDVTHGYFFAFDATSKRIQLRTTISNRSMTAKQFKLELLRLAAFADSHSSLWSSLTPMADKKATASLNTKATDSKGNAKPVASEGAFSLIGLWGGSLKSGESIAIRFKADSTFQLAAVKAGKSSLSKGKAVRAGNRLTLTGDDKVTLECEASQITADSFVLSIKDKSGKAALVVALKRSK